MPVKIYSKDRKFHHREAFINMEFQCILLNLEEAIMGEIKLGIVLKCLKPRYVDFEIQREDFLALIFLYLQRINSGE